MCISVQPYDHQLRVGRYFSLNFIFTAVLVLKSQCKGSNNPCPFRQQSGGRMKPGQWALCTLQSLNTVGSMVGRTSSRQKPYATCPQKFSSTTATTTTVFRPLYTPICISQHLQLRTGVFRWCRVLLLACPCWIAASIFRLERRRWSSEQSYLQCLCTFRNKWRLKT